MIIGPLTMNGVLYYFTHDSAPFRFGGAAFLMAALLSALAIVPFMRGVRENRSAIPVAAD